MLHNIVHDKKFLT